MAGWVLFVCGVQEVIHLELHLGELEYTTSKNKGLSDGP
jgi:hypothetical protein